MTLTASSSPADKLAALRKALKALGVDGLIVPHADEFLSEYLQPSAERLAWLTGFTGSAGAAVVLPDIAAAFTDGRYLVQIRQQVYPKLYEIVDITQAGVGDWLSSRAAKGQVIGYDPRLHTPKQIKAIADKVALRGLDLKPIENPIDSLWADRPVSEIKTAEVFPKHLAGRSSAEKRGEIAAAMREQGIDACVITLPDSLAWLLNIRGQDVPHNPLVLSYGILNAKTDGLDWFVDPAKITPEVRAYLGNAITIRRIEDFAAALQGLSGTVQVDHQRSPQWVIDQIGTASIRDIKDPCILPKSIKTAEEQAAMRTAHLRDGVAVTRLLCWLAQNGLKGGWTEIDVEKKLKAFRAENAAYRGDSFPTISGWAGHGAIIHYRATEKSNAKIVPPGLLLLDSGAQYMDGTTDITRTVAIGEPSAEMKDRFTRVLKAHIAVACAIFPAGTMGVQVDALARKPLWDAGLDFAHGTGHGVGCYLCVHEEAAGLSPRGQEVIRPGMIISNEPGFYKEREFGIRIENLVLCQEIGVTSSDGRAMLDFETLTLTPFDRSLIELNLLTQDERDWVDLYHDRVYDELSGFLSDEEKTWLRKVTVPL